MQKKKINTLEHYFKELPQFVREHSERVGYYAQQMNKQLLLLQQASRFTDWMLPVRFDVEVLGRYHDIGKIEISNDIWLKSGPLTDEERSIVQTHPFLGGRLIRRSIGLRNAEQDESDIGYLMLQCCLFHHERWDGMGYPNSLKGDDIPFYARLICIADAYDAMTADRPYHVGISKDLALQIIQEEAGKQFDPDLARVFCMLHRRHADEREPVFHEQMQILRNTRQS